MLYSIRISDIYKSNGPYLQHIPVSLKPYLIEKVESDRVCNYMMKCATYCKKYVPYRCKIREDKKHPHVRPPLNASIEHLLWLDQLSQKYVMTPFQNDLLNAMKSNFTGKKGENDNRCVKQVKDVKDWVKVGKGVFKTIRSFPL